MNVCFAMNVQSVAVDTTGAIPVFQKIAHCIDSTVPKMSSKQVAHYLISKNNNRAINAGKIRRVFHETRNSSSRKWP